MISNMVIKKLKIFITHLIHNYKLHLLGLGLFSLYIWVRFIRERLPRDIPFTLSSIGFIILLYICCIYLFIIIRYLRRPKTNEKVITIIIDWLYIPVETLDTYIKHLPMIKLYYKRFFIFLAYQSDYIMKHTSIFDLTFKILPRIILVTALFIDTFIFHKLFYLYKVLLIGILLFLGKYLLNSFKKLKKELIKEVELKTAFILIKYFPGIRKDVDDDIGDDGDEVPPTMTVTFEKYVETYSEWLVYKDYKFEYTFIAFYEYSKAMKEKYGCNRRMEIDKEINPKIKDILQIGTMLEYYEYMQNDNKALKKIEILIYTNYFLCWLYILIVSLPSLDIDNLFMMLEYTWLYVEEPFSNIIVLK
jgi:hypothetical protein